MALEFHSNQNSSKKKNLFYDVQLRNIISIKSYAAVEVIFLFVIN